jgi:hypothetical protein
MGLQKKAIYPELHLEKHFAEKSEMQIYLFHQNAVI